MKNSFRACLVVVALCGIVCRSLPAESQGTDYKGITDPFGDPSNYEFADDEKDDKEFFHLGRFVMIGFDVGMGIFTGGLGKTTAPAFYGGAHLLYFWDRSIAFELAGHYADHLDSLRFQQTGSNTVLGADLDTALIPVTMGFRYYFDTKNAPKAIAIANPYLVVGGGVYLRNISVIDNNASNIGFQPPTSSTNFGAFGGGGVEFAIYGNHIYMGVDLRYHYIFFTDASNTYGLPGQIDRSGNYFTAAGTLTYNF